jgi:benzoyl-CoA reductase/2-hydroxyglutaryl-CoA dehydratase subunit BcrC/BadD/HgdB
MPKDNDLKQKTNSKLECSNVTNTPEPETVSSIDDEVAQFRKITEEFRQSVKEKTSNPEKFLTINELEQFWTKYQEASTIINTNVVQETIRGLRESDLIRKKKLHTKRKELNSKPKKERPEEL